MMIQSFLRCAGAAATLALCAMHVPALSQTAPVVVDQPAPAAATAAVAPASADAQTFAELMVPRELFIDINMINFEKGMAIMAKQSPEMAQLFQQYPGLDVALTAASGKDLRAILESEYPDLKNKIALFASERYTTAELATLNKFYAGGAGVKLIRSEYETVDVEDMVKAFSDADGKLTEAEVRAMEAKASPKFGNDLTSAEKLAATKFFLGPIGRKIGQNKDAFQTLTVDWVNAVIAKNQARLQTTTTDTIMGFIEKSGAK